MPVLPPNTALLIIDMQAGFDDPVWGPRNNPQAEKNVAALLAAWRAAGAPVVHVHHDSLNPIGPLRPGVSGNSAKTEAEPARDEKVYRKTVNSAFIGTGLAPDLRARGIQSLVIIGLTTNLCISTSARMAGNLGFQTFVASDATAAFDHPGLNGRIRTAEAVHDAALGDLHNEFAQVVDTRWLIEALETHASNETDPAESPFAKDAQHA